MAALQRRQYDAEVLRMEARRVIDLLRKGEWWACVPHDMGYGMAVFDRGAHETVIDLLERVVQS